MYIASLFNKNMDLIFPSFFWFLDLFFTCVRSLFIEHGSFFISHEYFCIYPNAAGKDGETVPLLIPLHKRSVSSFSGGALLHIY